MHGYRLSVVVGVENDLLSDGWIQNVAMFSRYANAKVHMSRPASTSAGVLIQFTGALEARHFRDAVLVLTEQRCGNPGPWVFDVTGAAWPVAGRGGLNLLRPCPCLTGGECPLVCAFVVQGAEDEAWFRSYGEQRALDGFLVGVFTEQLAAIQWAQARTAALSAQRAYWRQKQGLSPSVLCQIQSHASGMRIRVLAGTDPL